MIYPKCLYRKKEITRVAQNIREHRSLAKQGWKDIWTDEKPYEFPEEVIIKEIEDADPKIVEQIIVMEKVKKKRSRKKVITQKVTDGNRKDTIT